MSDLEVSSAIIPATVLATGPQFQVFPNEVLLEILKYLLVLPDTHNAKTFRFLFLRGRISKMVKVSKNFAEIALEAFLAVNLVKLHPGRCCPKVTASGNIRPMMLPPVSFQRLVRRLQITIHLEDFFFMDEPEVNNAPSGSTTRVCRPIINTTQLYRYCGGARQLRDLTHAVTGFNHLKDLDLEIFVLFASNIDTSLAVYRAAGLSVHAGHVTMTLRLRHGVGQEWYLPLLEKTIAVE